MAVVIESVSSTSNMSSPVTDVGSTGEFTVTYPSGLTVGDMMLVFASTNLGSVGAGSTGFTSVSIPSDIGGQTQAFYKVADSSDVSAGSGTFTTTGGSSDYGYVCYRLTGCRTSGEPILNKEGATAQLTEGTYTAEPISVSLSTGQIPSGSMVIMCIGKLFTGVGVNADLSAYSVTGGSLTFTERADWDNSTDDDGMALADAIAGSTMTITAANYEVDSLSLSSGETWTGYTNLLIVYPQQDAAGTAGFTTTSQSAFTPAGQADANASPAITTTNQSGFNPTTTTFNPQKWTTITKS